VPDTDLAPDLENYEQPRHVVWESTEMRTALANRRIASAFRLLQKYGVSQRRIAKATHQSQSEISEILSGRRIVAYDVLERIAYGLGVPRGFMGLDYDESTLQYVEALPEAPPVMGLLLPGEHTCPNCRHRLTLRRRAVNVQGRIRSEVATPINHAQVHEVSAAAADDPAAPGSGE
jgi:transcriptional regulator with XRE-family HTH domain